MNKFNLIAVVLFLKKLTTVTFYSLLQKLLKYVYQIYLDW